MTKEEFNQLRSGDRCKMGRLSLIMHSKSRELYAEHVFGSGPDSPGENVITFVLVGEDMFLRVGENDPEVEKMVRA